MKLYTSRYQNGAEIQDRDLVPVGITVGSPRFRLAFQPVYLRMLAPDREDLKRPDWAARYRAKLETLDPDEIRTALERIHEVYGRDLALLCFENVYAEGPESCHRRIFAEWWEETTGETVEELPEGTRRVPLASRYVREKAARLVAQGRVRKISDDRYQVAGDSGLYTVRMEGEVPVSCGCESYERDPNVICAHRLSAYMDATGYQSTLF